MIHFFNGIKTQVCWLNRENGQDKIYVRDRSWRLRCSLLLKALLQNWHLYLRSGAKAVFLDGAEEACGGKTATLAPGIV